MGQQLTGFLAEAEKISLQAKMIYVMYSGLTSSEAASKPDSPELIKKCKDALARVKTEISKRS